MRSNTKRKENTMLRDDLQDGLTFDDVLLVPNRSAVLPNEVEVDTWLTPTIPLKIPLISAAMDTVTESRTAISMAREGGIGIIHRNMSIEAQVTEVDQVKKSESGMIIDPITVHPDQRIREALELMRRYRISGVPVTVEGRLVGILTNRDLRFETDLDKRVSEVMTKDNLVTVHPGITLDESKVLLHKHRIEKLLVVDDRYRLTGLITIKDIEKTIKYPSACKDHLGRLRVGAAVGTSPETMNRVEALLRAGVDLIVVDTSHGHSERVIRTVREIKSAYPNSQVAAGNVATGEGALALIEAGVDAVKVGVGPGSICTTRIVAGVGVPQITAISEAYRVSAERDVPIIADGGIKFSGDIPKAIAAGANSVMIGSLLAGTEESPGETVLYQGRTYKVYRGMGSTDAMRQGSRDRYGLGEDEEASKLVPEGIVGRVPYRGPLSSTVYQLVGGLRSGMGYLGSRDLQELRKQARFIRITPAGLRESHVHDVIITQEAPNYRLENI
jgi:IMP dehydrogenase